MVRSGWVRRRRRAASPTTILPSRSMLTTEGQSVLPYGPVIHTGLFVCGSRNATRLLVVPSSSHLSLCRGPPATGNKGRDSRARNNGVLPENRWKALRNAIVPWSNGGQTPPQYLRGLNKRRALIARRRQTVRSLEMDS